MRILFMLLAFILVSCRNKKTEIVERQKELKRDILQEKSKQETFVTLQRSNKTPRDSVMFFIDKQVQSSMRQDSLQAIYDSLEMELKKY